MRFKSKKQDGYTIYAVSGINTISFAIDFEEANTKGLLGFSVEREDHQENEKYFMYGFKVFEENESKPNESTTVSTKDNPVQSFVWDDFTGKPGYLYTYNFYPVKGKPERLVHLAPIEIKVKTELAFSNEKHDIFFNRGVASSQAYVRRFNNKKPSDLPPEKQKEALAWLGRDLDVAMIKFINQATNKDALRGCFYEFHYNPILEAYKKAIDRGVDVKLIVDAKNNSQEFPRKANLSNMKKVGIPDANIILRDANTNSIMHNKFCVLLKGANRTPTEVWTGSTNISMGGIYGQTNVGHWVKDEQVAKDFMAYWTLLSSNPGMIDGDSNIKRRKDNAKYKDQVMDISPSMAPKDIYKISNGVTCFFSPRSGSEVLNTYAHLVDQANYMSGVTLAFGISAVFKDLIVDNNYEDQVIFMLLEKEDKPRWNSTKPFVPLTTKNNVYQAYGSKISDNLYQWTKETNTQYLKLNTHVKYVHSKFLLHDPLNDEPIIVTGSANFSNASTNSNDENMLVIKGDTRVADIYFTEFNRLFNHYYFRSVYNDLKKRKKKPKSEYKVSLLDNDSWVKKYKPGLFKYKRLELYRNMKRFTKL